MEIKKIIKDFGIIGVVSKYQDTLDNDLLVKDLKLKNDNKALVMVGLDDKILDKKIKELSFSEKFKLDLATKLDKDIIIIGNLSKSLIYKEQDYIKKLLIKLSNNYNKKIVVIDEDISVFFNLTKKIYVMKNKEVIYDTDNYFDDNLYKYCKMPKIVEFIKYVNKSNKRVDENIEIYELLKDIYRRIS